MKSILKQISKGLLLVPALLLGLSVAVPATVSALGDPCGDTLSIANGANCAAGTDQPAKGCLRMAVSLRLSLTSSYSSLVQSLSSC